MAATRRPAASTGAATGATEAGAGAGRPTPEPGAGHPVDGDTVDAVLTASRTMVALATRSLGTVADQTSIAQYRALVVLASRGPQRLVDLAGALDVAPSTAGRMCDRLVLKKLVTRHRTHADRRAVLVSLTATGRRVVDEATARRRVIVTEILRRLPAPQQRAAATALGAFSDAAGEIPDSRWPAGPAEDTPPAAVALPPRYARAVVDADGADIGGSAAEGHRKADGHGKDGQ